MKGNPRLVLLGWACVIGLIGFGILVSRPSRPANALQTCPRGTCTPTPTPSPTATPTTTATATASPTASPTPTPTPRPQPGTVVTVEQDRAVSGSVPQYTNFSDVSACPRVTVSISVATVGGPAALSIQSSLDGVTDYGYLAIASIAGGVTWTTTGYVVGWNGNGGAVAPNFTGSPFRSSVTLAPYAPKLRFSLQGPDGGTATFTVLFYCASA